MSSTLSLLIPDHHICWVIWGKIGLNVHMRDWRFAMTIAQISHAASLLYHSSGYFSEPLLKNSVLSLSCHKVTKRNIVYRALLRAVALQGKLQCFNKGSKIKEIIQKTADLVLCVAKILVFMVYCRIHKICMGPHNCPQEVYILAGSCRDT